MISKLEVKSDNERFIMEVINPDMQIKYIRVSCYQENLLISTIELTKDQADKVGFGLLFISRTF